MSTLQNNKNIQYTLRFAPAMCFDHGACGIVVKKIWLNYFAVFGIGQLMPILGVADILMDISLPAYPERVVLTWRGRLADHMVNAELTYKL